MALNPVAQGNGAGAAISPESTVRDGSMSGPGPEIDLRQSTDSSPARQPMSVTRRVTPATGAGCALPTPLRASLAKVAVPMVSICGFPAVARMAGWTGNGLKFSPADTARVRQLRAEGARRPALSSVGCFNIVVIRGGKVELQKGAFANIGTHMFRTAFTAASPTSASVPMPGDFYPECKSRNNRIQSVVFSYMNQMGHNRIRGPSPNRQRRTMRSRQISESVKLGGSLSRYSRQLLSVRSTSRTIAAKSAAPGAIDACAMCRSR